MFKKIEKIGGKKISSPKCCLIFSGIFPCFGVKIGLSLLYVINRAGLSTFAIMNIFTTCNLFKRFTLFHVTYLICSLWPI